MEMMQMLAIQFNSLTASEIALLMVALEYAVLAPAWLVAAWVLEGDRRAAGYWMAYSVGSALALACIVAGIHTGETSVRAVGNVLVIVATMALQRGIWAFSGQRISVWPHAVMLAVTVVLSWRAALDPAWVPVRIGVVAALWAGMYFWAALDVWRHVRLALNQRWSALYATPLVLTGVMLAARSLRAVVAPDTVSFEVEQNTVLNVGSSFTALVAALMLQMLLLSLLVRRLLERLERLLRHDALTGLLNRRAIDELLVQEEQRMRRLSGRVSVLMIDIDHFKRINDSMGHAVGDRALQHLAAVMRSQLREIDHLARWGGEEFVVLLPATSGAEAAVMAERLCERVRQLPLVNDDHRLALTASVGVAEWQGAGDTVASLLARADAALYAAKRDGRDRVRTSHLGVPGQVHAA